MTMRCMRCGRVTLHPAVFIGGRPVGSTCAKRAGLIDTKPKAPRHVAKKPRKRKADAQAQVQRDEQTMDLFNGITL